MAACDSTALEPVQISFEAAAREFLAAHGAAITLRGSRRHGCCGGTAFVPVAEPGRPSSPERYRALQVDGITVFLESGVGTIAEPIVIGIDGLWRWRRLRVEGLAIQM